MAPTSPGGLTSHGTTEMDVEFSLSSPSETPTEFDPSQLFVDNTLAFHSDAFARDAFDISLNPPTMATTESGDPMPDMLNSKMRFLALRSR